MTTPTSRLAYLPYYEILDRALASTRGIQLRVTDRGEANQLRVCLHTARSLDRDLSRETYELGDPKHGVSVYDQLIVKIRQDGDDVVVAITPRTVIGEIEEISA